MWQLQLLQTSGFSDWRTHGPSHNLLSAACYYKRMDLVLFALEIARFDPSILGYPALGTSANQGWVEGVAVLVESGFHPNINGHPHDPLGTLALCPGYDDDRTLSLVGHYLLLKGYDPVQRDWFGSSGWLRIFQIIYRLGPPLRLFESFQFTHIEGSISHTLHHGADPFEIFSVNHPRGFEWYEKPGRTQASDFARLWSSGICVRRHLDNSVSHLPRRLKQKLEQADYGRKHDQTFQWNASGRIRRWYVHPGNGEELEERCSMGRSHYPAN